MAYIHVNINYIYLNFHIKLHEYFCYNSKFDMNTANLLFLTLLKSRCRQSVQLHIAGEPVHE